MPRRSLRTTRLASVVGTAVIASVACAAPVAVGAAPPAPAPASVRVIARAAFGPARTDGTTIVYAASDGQITLGPAAGGGARSSVSVMSSCAADRPMISAAGGGQALFECGGTRDEAYFQVDEAPLLLDLATHAVHMPAGAAEQETTWQDAEDGSNSFEAIGAYGIRARYMAYHTDSTTVIDWHTGRTVGRVFDPPSIEDLDWPTLWRPLCVPVRRALAYDPPLALRVRWGKLLLVRCGSAHVRVLARGVHDPRLAEGFASWWTGDARIVRLAHCRLRVPAQKHAFADHVRGGLLLSDRSTEAGPWRIRLVSLRGACGR